jgi:hypothetical protein
MFRKILWMPLVTLLSAVMIVSVVAEEKKEVKKVEKKPDPKDEKKAERSGTVVGLLTAKAERWIEVKADGEEKSRRYIPHWKGGNPAMGGGPDKKTLELIRELSVGSRIKLDWSFEEHFRIEKVEVLKKADLKEKKE